MPPFPYYANLYKGRRDEINSRILIPKRVPTFLLSLSFMRRVATEEGVTNDATWLERRHSLYWLEIVNSIGILPP